MSSCYNTSTISSLLSFSITRNPVDKFESGVKELWSSNPQQWGHLSADEILDQGV